MANTVVLKRSAVQGKTPTTSDLALGELALNTYDGNLFFKRNVSSTETVVRVATNTNLLSYTRVTSNTTAVSRQSYIADTSGGTFTITLPASPASGDWVVIADGASFQTTALTVGRNSSTIADIAENLSLNIEGVSVTFVYDGSTWEVYTQVGANGGDGTFTASSTTTFTNKTISGSSNTLSNIGNSSLTNSSISINGSAISLGGSVTGLVSTGDTGTVTNTMLAGSIANAKLANSSVTVNGTSISLGSSGTVTAAADTLTGTELKSTVVTSSLTSVGTLTGLTTSGAASITYTPGSATGVALTTTGKDTQGGTGYFDFFRVTNTTSGVTNGSKTFRLNNIGTLEVINSAYTSTIATLTNAGNLAVTGTVTAGAYTAGQVIKDTMLSNSEFTVNATTVATSTTDTDFITYSYTPVSSSSYLIIHVHVASYEAAKTGGSGQDSYFSRIKVDGTEITYGTQYTRDTYTFRTGTLFPLTGRYTNSNTTAKSITVGVRRDSADDSITIVNSATALWMRITEVAR